MTGFIQVSTTVNTRQAAKKIGRQLLAERVSSCVQVLGPIQSSYWWKGKINHAKEWLCLIKARAIDYPRIQAIIKKMHSYDVPEVIALPVVRGSPDYLKWISMETTLGANRNRRNRGNSMKGLSGAGGF